MWNTNSNVHTNKTHTQTKRWKPPPVRVYISIAFYSFYIKLQLNAKYFEQLFFRLLLLIAPVDTALVSSTPLLHFHFPKFLWWGERAHGERRGKKNPYKRQRNTEPQQIISKKVLPLSHTHRAFHIEVNTNSFRFQNKWSYVHRDTYIHTNTCNRIIYFTREWEQISNQKDIVYFYNYSLLNAEQRWSSGDQENILDPEPEQLVTTGNLIEVVQLWQSLRYRLLSRNICLDTETFSLVPK